MHTHINTSTTQIQYIHMCNIYLYPYIDTHIHTPTYIKYITPTSISCLAISAALLCLLVISTTSSLVNSIFRGLMTSLRVCCLNICWSNDRQQGNISINNKTNFENSKNSYSNNNKKQQYNQQEKYQKKIIRVTLTTIVPVL